MQGTESPVPHGSPLEWDTASLVDLNLTILRPGLALTDEEYLELLTSFRAQPRRQHLLYSPDLQMTLYNLCAGLVSSCVIHKLFETYTS